MTSYQITISPSRRAGVRYIGKVRRAIQQALMEDGITQSELARKLGVHRSVISREIRGEKDLTLSRVGELAYEMGRRADFAMPKRAVAHGTNIPTKIEIENPPASSTARVVKID